jgi:hypothetical protein
MSFLPTDVLCMKFRVGLIKVHVAGDNRFGIQCSYLGVWEKVTKRGPWLFWFFMISPYGDFSDPHMIELNHMLIWLHVAVIIHITAWCIVSVVDIILMNIILQVLHPQNSTTITSQIQTYISNITRCIQHYTSSSCNTRKLSSIGIVILKTIMVQQIIYVATKVVRPNVMALCY